MVVIEGLEKFKKAVEHVNQISTVTQARSFYAKLQDDISFRHEEMNVDVRNVPFTVSAKKEIEVEVSFSYDYANTSVQVFIYKTGKPVVPVYQHLPIGGLLNPIFQEFLDNYRSMAFALKDGVIPASVSMKILGYVCSYLTNIRDSYKSVRSEYIENFTDSLVYAMARGEKDRPMKTWVIRKSQEGKEAIIIRAQSPSQAYTLAMRDGDIPLIDYKTFLREGMDTTTLQLILLNHLNQEYPIYSI